MINSKKVPDTIVTENMDFPFVPEIYFGILYLIIESVINVDL